jgi:sulfoxide reductase catalytic subunit YedY
MNKRRQFLQIVLGWITTIGLNKSRLLHAGKEPLTPLKEFGTMGLTDYEADLDRWRLEISGRVISPFKLTYSEIISLPAFEKEVLLNCPGFFFKFPMEHILSDRVFLAYGVNGQTLPQKHGFPLRVVAASYAGDEWVKYVYKMKIM